MFGAQDGILSTVALVTSVAVAIGDGATILVAGLAAALAGMISMATGAYLGSRAEQDVQQAEIAREAREMEENPAESSLNWWWFSNGKGGVSRKPVTWRPRSPRTRKPGCVRW